MVTIYNFQMAASVEDKSSAYWNKHYCVNQPGDSSGMYVKQEEYSILLEQKAALVEALRPFAACAEVWQEDDADFVAHWSRRNVPDQPDLKITVGDLLAARAALASVEPEGGE